MAKTVVGLFQDFSEAQNVIQDLVDAGFSSSDISLASTQMAQSEPSQGTGHLVGQDTGVGAEVGGFVGLLVGLGALTVPGVGPLLAAGPLASALGAVVGATVVGVGVGAVAGGLIGALTHLGVPPEHAEYYAEGVRRGATLVTLTVAENLAAEAAAILSRDGASGIEMRSAKWRITSHIEYESRSFPYASEDITRQQDQWSHSNTHSGDLETTHSSDVHSLDADDTLDTERMPMRGA